jgi:hypothetical protein
VYLLRFFLCTVAWYISLLSSIFFCFTLFFYVRSFILRKTLPVTFFFVRYKLMVPWLLFYFFSFLLYTVVCNKD